LRDLVLTPKNFSPFCPITAVDFRHPVTSTDFHRHLAKIGPWNINLSKAGRLGVKMFKRGCRQADVTVTRYM